MFKIIPNQSSKPACQREQVGVLEEYWQGEGFGKYLGHRSVDKSSQLFGSENTVTLTVKEPFEINRSFSKRLTIKAGQVVTRMCSPLEGREMR